MIMKIEDRWQDGGTRCHKIYNMTITDKTELLALYDALSFYTNVKEANGQKYSSIFTDLKVKVFEELGYGLNNSIK